MGTLIMIGQFLLGITILVGIHEAGHMLFAKLFGMRVEKFSIGFPPVAYSFKKGETIYQIGMIPLGGFVKIAGMVDESMDVNQLAEAPKSWEFRSKPAWQRMLVMLGGIIFNVVLGCLLFSFLLFKAGETVTPIDNMKYGLHVEELGKKIGLIEGDQIIAVNDEKVIYFHDILGEKLLFGDSPEITVLRGIDSVYIAIPDYFLEELSNGSRFITYDFDFSIGQIQKNSNAEKAGLHKGDLFLGVNGIGSSSFYEFKTVLDNNKNKEVVLQLLRDNNEISVKALVDSSGRLGFYPVNSFSTHSEIPFYVALGKGPLLAYDAVANNIKGIGKMFSGKLDPAKSTKGMIGIAEMFGEEMTMNFWVICAYLTMALAFFNLLPIPGLDGGHVMFLLYEMVVGKPASQKVQEVALKLGFVLLITLMLLVNGNELIQKVTNLF